MGLNASNVEMPEGNGKKQEQLEAGNYLARLVQVVDLGLQPQDNFKGEEKPPAHRVMFGYELGTEFMKDEDGKDMEDKPRWISEDFPFYNLKADLAKSTKRIKAMDPSLSKEGRLADMLGMPCTVTVVVDKNNKTGKTYVNVGNITPPMKGIPVPELKNDPRLFELDEPDMEIFEGLPDWIQNKVKSNLEFNGSPLQKALGIEQEEKPEDPAPEGDSSDDNPY
jgi:hypothetical protein